MEVTGAPTLVQIDVRIEPGQTLTFRPYDGYKWGLAKVALHTMGDFVIECFHTGSHLFSFAIVAAVQRGMPFNSVLNGLMDPQAVFVTAAMLEEASTLHNDEPSVWNGVVWKCDIGEVRQLSVAIARYFLEADLYEALGTAGNIQGRPPWWAGGAANFIEPIERFAKVVAQTVISESGRGDLSVMQRELVFVGILDNATFTVSSFSGLFRFYRNALFFQSVFHASLFHAREYLTPLGLPHSDKLAPLLSGAKSLPVGTATQSAINTAFLGDLQSIFSASAWASMMYGTAGGFEGPELGDGSYFNCSILADAISAFRHDVDEARGAVYKEFAGRNGGYVPLCFYPKQVKAAMPVQCKCPMTQTTYV